MLGHPRIKSSGQSLQLVYLVEYKTLPRARGRAMSGACTDIIACTSSYRLITHNGSAMQILCGDEYTTFARGRRSSSQYRNVHHEQNEPQLKP